MLHRIALLRGLGAGTFWTSKAGRETGGLLAAAADAQEPGQGAAGKGGACATHAGWMGGLVRASTRWNRHCEDEPGTVSVQVKWQASGLHLCVVHLCVQGWGGART